MEKWRRASCREERIAEGMYVIGEVLGVQNGEVILGKGGVPKMAKHDRFVSVAKWSERIQNGPKRLTYRLFIIWNHNVSIWTLSELFSQK